MPTTNKHKDERLAILHKCFSSRQKKWTREQLFEKICDELDDVNVSQRTIISDIDYLKNIKFAPIERLGKGKNTYYQYEDNYDFNLNEPKLDIDELFSLELAYSILSQLNEFNLSQELKTVIKKMHKTLTENDFLTEEVIFFEPGNIKLKPQLFQDIVTACKEKSVLELKYKPFWKDENVVKIIHPFFVKQYNKRWFLIGFDEVKNRIDNSPIDRIIAIKPKDKEFDSSKIITNTAYSKNIVGVSRDGRPQKITLEFSAHRTPYYLSKPFSDIFLEQKVKRNGNTKVVHELIINKELIQQLLSYGADVKVITPALLVEKMKDEAFKMNAQYSNL